MLQTLFEPASVQFVLRTLLRLGVPRADVEDLAQEVFMVVHRRIDAFDTDRRIEPWLFGIAKHVARDERRLARHRHEAPGDGANPASVPADDGAGDAHVLHRALAALPDELREVVIACDLTELTVAEAVIALEMPEGTVKARLRRGRERLRAELVRLGVGAPIAAKEQTS